MAILIEGIQRFDWTFRPIWANNWRERKEAVPLSLIPVKVVVTGLQSEFTQDLVRMLIGMNYSVSESTQQISEADMVFCDADSMEPIIARKSARRAKIVAVGSSASEESWLSALDGGAADDLPMPCQRVELDWILKSHFGPRAPQAA